ncbi:5'-nucleotidase C-terminal domain-containing protein [uncultured Desulfobacter sp.]|uniref:bifunctional metallophosphatase/5'-nucleotidase n=1 Tax=uncultured Desulfobacter sp. TaxID=240139 RepID=UPI002AAA6D29|nr:5'-nucleotidase C-terminal domain-containing protein [uncultured Desulfobacter sp.]
MKPLQKQLWCLLLMVFLTIISSCNGDDDKDNSSSTESNRLSLTIMHVNDTHSYAEGDSLTLDIEGTETTFEAGGYPRLVQKVNEIRAESSNTLLLHAGDAVQGTLYFTAYEGEADYEFLNEMGVDVMCVGNHEFDKGPEYLDKFIDYADFPIISANIDASADDYLAGEIEPYVIKEYNGEKVGIIGLTTTTTAGTSSPGNNIVFNNVVDAVNTYVAELEGRGINKIILLTHLGYDEDVELAQEVQGVDIIVGGHSHTLLGGEDLKSLGFSPSGDYPTAVENPDGGKTYVVQAYAHTLVLGKLNVEFDADGVVTGIEGTPILLLGENNITQEDENGDDVEVTGESLATVQTVIAQSSCAQLVAEDAGAATALEPYSAGIAAKEEEVVASASSNLYHTRVPFTDKYAEGVPLPYGSYIAPVVAEGMLWKANGVGQACDFALINAGGPRKTIPKGDITIADVYELLPFGNTLFALELTGAQWKAALQLGVTEGADGSDTGGYPYVAGCRYIVDALTDPDNPTVTAVQTQDDDGSWVDIDDDETYRIITINYLANGGDFYDVLKNSSGYRYDTGFIDAEVFQEYAEHVGTLDRPDSTNVIYTTGAVVLKMIETTDIHGSLLPYDFIEAEAILHSLTQVNTYVTAEREKASQSTQSSVILLDCGDILQGQPIVNYYNYERETLDNHIVPDAMNYMGYDAGTVGNHDIEPGKSVYDAVNSQFNFPWLAANCVDTTTNDPYFEPYTIIEKNGIRIAVLGLITPQVPSWLPESVRENMAFDDMIESAQAWVPYIQENEDPDLIVGLFHSGTDYTYSGTETSEKNENASELVARQVPGFDIVFTGHDHANHAYTVENTQGKTVWILGATSAANYLADATVVLTPDGEGSYTVEVDGLYKDATVYDVDQDMYSYFSYAEDATNEYVDEAIGTFTASTTSRDAMFGDSSFNDLIHALQFTVARDVIGQSVEVSFAAPLQFDKTIDAGTVYVRDMYKLYKYENTLYVMQLTGAEIDAELEYSYANWTNQMTSADDHLINFTSIDEKTGEYEQATRYYNYDSAAGIVYTVNVSQPAYDRVSILGLDADLDGVVDEGSAWDDTATYNCAVNSYRAGGGGGHLTTGAGIDEDALSDRQVGVTARDLRYYLIEDIKAQGTVTPMSIGNWEFIPADWAAAGAERDYDVLYGNSDGDH